MSRYPALLAVICVFLAGAMPAWAQSADGTWHEAALIPINQLAPPRRHGRLPQPVAGRPENTSEGLRTPQPVAAPDVGAPEPAPDSSDGPAQDLGGVLPFEASEDVVHPELGFGMFWPVGASGEPSSRIAPSLGGMLWQGMLGIGAETVIFGNTYVSERQAPALRADTPLTDVGFHWRSTTAAAGEASAPSIDLSVGYRGLGLGDVNFLTAGAIATVPLGVRGISLRGRLLGGVATSGALCVDGRAGVLVRSHVFEAEAGIRDLSIFGGGLPGFELWGPHAGLTLSF